MTTPTMEVKPEPLLELMEGEQKWLGDLLNSYETEQAMMELVGILLRVEAGRRRAEFRWRKLITIHPISSPPDPRHNWTPADWLALVEREIKGERC